MTQLALEVPRSWTITVPFDPSKLSANQRLHWGKRRKLALPVRLAAGAAWCAAGRPRANRPVRVSLTIRRDRALDYDNALSGCKVALDELFVGRVTRDDGPKYLTIGSITQETGSQWNGREEVSFLIEEV